MITLTELLLNNRQRIAKLIAPQLSSSHFAMVHLGRDDAETTDHDLQTLEGVANCVQQQLDQHQAKAGYGGYLEQRDLYASSPHFRNETEDRCIHLGLDIWQAAGTPIFAPIEGRVHSFANNDNPYDYGGTIILEHRLEKRRFYSLYGHLSLDSLDALYKGLFFPAGEVFAYLGDTSENGGWVPHLHLQLITEIGQHKGDFPGVVSREQLDTYRDICPDPTPLIYPLIGWPDDQ